MSAIQLVTGSLPCRYSFFVIARYSNKLKYKLLYTKAVSKMSHRGPYKRYLVDENENVPRRTLDDRAARAVQNAHQIEPQPSMRILK